MLETLYAIEKQLPDMLCEKNIWKSVLVDYHPPVVERLYMYFEEIRVCLHCIHPCNDSTPLFHTHPWPSAMRIVQGKYVMNIGYGKTRPEKIAATVILPQGASYEMTERDGWHDVQPPHTPSLSVMVNGSPWDNTLSFHTPSHYFKPLADARIDELLLMFQQHYPL
jgi:hypothetical protein